MPRANTLFIGRLPPGATWRRGREEASGKKGASDPKAAAADKPEMAVGPQIIDWDRSHPLLASVELGNVDIADSMVLHPPDLGFFRQQIVKVTPPSRWVLTCAVGVRPCIIEDCLDAPAHPARSLRLVGP